MLRSPLALAFASALGVSSLVSACGGDDDDDGGGDAGVDAAPQACGEIDGRCVELSPSSDDQTAVQTALIQAQPGDVILFHAGTYTFQSGLTLAVENVTLRGEGEQQTILSFAGQLADAQGLLVTSDGFTAEELAVVDTAGDAIKVEGASRVVFRKVRTEWTTEPSADHGAYGLYPVQCTDILIEDSIVIGAADAGIYVGQSERAVVRRNQVERNVAGIEIENTIDADVYDNTATNNTGGILVFNLPNLQLKNGSTTRVFDNQIVENNGENFAAAGTTVAMVPPGTGFVALAAHGVEFFGNTVSNNQTNQVGVISYFFIGEPNDAGYNPYSDTLFFHDNVFEGGGDMPAGVLGAIVRAALDSNLMMPPAAIPDIAIDHIFDPAKIDEGTGELLPEFNICVRDNGDADFVSLDAGGDPAFSGMSMDASPYDCAHDPLPAVALQGVTL